MLPLNLYARVRVFKCAIAHETAGAARIRSSLRPLTLGGQTKYKPRADACRENAKLCPSVIASAAKQSIVSAREDGLLRCARNDVVDGPT